MDRSNKNDKPVRNEEKAPVRRRRSSSVPGKSSRHNVVIAGKRKKGHGKNSSFRYFLGTYTALWVVLTVVLCTVLWKNLSNYQRDYDAAKAAGAPELAMQENMELFTADKIGDVIDTQQLDISSRFETIEQYKDFYKGYLQNKNVRYIKNDELYNDARPVYNVMAFDSEAADTDEGELLAIVSLKAAGEKDSFGFNKWEIKDIAISENIYDYHEVYVRVMDDMDVYINGIKLDEREYITGGVIDNAVSDMAYELTGVSFNYNVYYAGELVQEPQVSVIDAQGNDVTADYVDAENGLKDYEATASPEFIAGVQDMVQSFCETYVYHIYRKASVDSVAAMMEDGSEAERLLYNAQSTLAWAWVPETVEILDESYDEFMYYNDSYFSCRSTINIRKEDSKTTEDEEFICQWLFKKVNGQWLVTYFVLG